MRYKWLSKYFTSARCILSAHAVVLLGLRLCGKFISHLIRVHNEVQKENWALPTKFLIKVNISALLSLKNVWLLFCTFLKFMLTLAFPVFSRTSQEDKTNTTTTTNSLYGKRSKSLLITAYGQLSAHAHYRQCSAYAHAQFGHRL